MVLMVLRPPPPPQNPPLSPEKLGQFLQDFQKIFGHWAGKSGFPVEIVKIHLLLALDVDLCTFIHSCTYMNEACTAACTDTRASTRRVPTSPRFFLGLDGPLSESLAAAPVVAEAAADSSRDPERERSLGHAPSPHAGLSGRHLIPHFPWVLLGLGSPEALVERMWGAGGVYLGPILLRGGPRDNALEPLLVPLMWRPIRRRANGMYH